jgi:hypothetical protein
MSRYVPPPFLGSDFNGRYKSMYFVGDPHHHVHQFVLQLCECKFDVEKMFDFNFDTGYPYSEPRILPLDLNERMMALPRAFSVFFPSIGLHLHSGLAQP